MDVTRLGTSVVVGALLALSVAGCGGGSTPTPADIPVAVGEGAEIGQTILSQDWEITLIEPPYTSQQVGSGTAKAAQSYAIGTLDAEGIFLIVPIQLTNAADEMRMFSRASSELIVTDGQGRATLLGLGRVHMTLVYNSERWGKEENQLVQNPLDAGVTWEGPVVFDVPEDATGLSMSFKGSEESIDLGL